MRKVFKLLFLLMSLITNQSYSQPRFGLTSAMNLSVLTGTVNMETNLKPGIMLGGVVDIPLGNIVSLQPGLVYSAQGSSITYYRRGPGSAVTGETNINLNYINVPVALHVYLGESFFLQAGPQLGFLLSAKEKGEIDNDDVNEDVKEGFTSTEFSLMTGLGFRLQGDVILGGRYNLGLSDISTADDEIISGLMRPSLHNNVLQFYITKLF